MPPARPSGTGNTHSMATTCRLTCKVRCCFPLALCKQLSSSPSLSPPPCSSSIPCCAGFRSVWHQAEIFCGSAEMLDRVDKKREKVSRKRVSCSLQEPLCSSNLPAKKRRCWQMSESMQVAYLSAAFRRGQVYRGCQAGLSSCWGILCRSDYRGQPCGCVQAPGASCDVQSVRNRPASAGCCC